MLGLNERYDIFLKCVHCGLCISACPTYQVFRTEVDSPRGRLHILRAIADGRIRLTPRVIKHLDICLDCRACFSECPASVEYPLAIEAVRLEMFRSGAIGVSRKLLSFILDRTISSPRTLLGIVHIINFMRTLRLFSIADRIGLWGPWNPFARLEMMVPMEARPIAPLSGIFGPEDPGKKAIRVGFFKGCVMESLYPKVNISTVKLLVDMGCEVVVPRDQGCCGAPSLHLGFPDRAEEMARKNMDIFRDSDVVITNCAGCGAMMKGYGESFGGRFRAFSEKVKDICEFISELLPKGWTFGRADDGIRITYHDPCHLAHAQGIREQPRELIKAVEGVEFVEMRDPDRCCGGAGTYGILHPSISLELLSRKIENIEGSGAKMLITANPGCMMQIGMGIRIRGLNLKVLHIVEFLRAAQEGGKGVRKLWE